MSFFRSIVAFALFAALGAAAHAEDGYDLWLRYRPLSRAAISRAAPHAKSIVAECSTPTMRIACDELERGLSGLLGRKVGHGPPRRGAIVLKRSAVPGIGGEGFRIRTSAGSTVIEANSDIGVLHGVFAYLQLVQTGRDLAQINITDVPKVPLRMLDHWDNLDGTVERGYSGRSLWDWSALPAVSTRIIDYARVNASIGINGVVLNNVNASAQILTPSYLAKVAALADAWRPYGIKVYVSARFSAPIEIGRLKTADPLDPAVRRWWRDKADEIYRAIPDFGGFLVKANAEGQPGPQAYGRTHSDGANMLAAALAPHGGTLIWRAFVYSSANADDRTRQAYAEFQPLDGKFARNVIIQVKNGPLDFQPREPFHPLFGAMPRTRVALEAQLTREYLGQGSGIVFLAPMWSQVLRSRTYRPRAQSQVRDTIAAMAGVANAGSDRNWTGSDFDQANWYAFGRLAWNPQLESRAIAEEWARMTWGNDRRLVAPVVKMMLGSRQAAVDYMNPLGLAHLMASDHHYGPGPWVHDQPAALWNPTYYHRADALGIGFDRTTTGSNAVAQYTPQAARCFASLRCVPEDELLWFHHLQWNYRTHSGRPLWDELVVRYDRGVQAVDSMRQSWAALTPLVDADRHRAVAASLDRQWAEARWWRDASIAYWQSLNGMPLPAGHGPPSHPLSWYETIHFDTVPGFLAPRIDQAVPCPPTQGDQSCVR